MDPTNRLEPRTAEGREAQRAVDDAIAALERFTRAYLDHADPGNGKNSAARRAFARDAGRLVLAVTASVGGTLATLVASTLGDDARRLLRKLQDISNNYDQTAMTTNARKLLEVVIEGLVEIEVKTLHVSAGLKNGSRQMRTDCGRRLEGAYKRAGQRWTREST